VVDIDVVRTRRCWGDSVTQQVPWTCQAVCRL